MSRTSRVLAAVGVAVAIGAGSVVALRHEKAASRADTTLFYGQTLRDASGQERPLADYRGKVVVVNFWATWCVPCVKEIPTLSKVSAEVARAAGDRVAFVGLGIDSAENIAAFATRFKPSYPLLGAGAAGTDLARAFGDEAGALPFTVVLDDHGRIVATHLGQVDEAMLRGWLAPYIGPRTSGSRT